MNLSTHALRQMSAAGFTALLSVSSLLSVPAFAAAPQAPDAPPNPILVQRPQDVANGDYGDYLTYGEMLDKIAAWKRDYPTLVTVSSLGRTYEGRDIPLVRLGAGPDDGKTPEVMLIAGIHPREQQPPMGVASLVDEILWSNGKASTPLAGMLKDRVLWIVPIFNVDGKVYDMQHGNGTTRGADWRKNRHPNADGTTVGIDLNRNFGVRWGGNHLFDTSWATTTDTPKGNIYEGTAPLSEPEDRALIAFIESRKGHLHGFLDLHSPFGEILAPSYVSGPDYASYRKLLDDMKKEQKEPYKVTELKQDTDPKPGQRSGDSGISYTYIYYTQGIFALNLEYAPPREAKRGVVARYPPPPEAAEEYRRNVRGALIKFIQDTGDLPLPTTGTATIATGNGTLGAPLAPGASAVAWTPPAITGPWSYAVLVSEGAEIGVSSEYRHAPLASPFTLEVNAKAKPGATVPMTLYVWNADRGLSTAHFTLTIAPGTAATTAAAHP